MKRIFRKDVVLLALSQLYIDFRVFEDVFVLRKRISALNSFFFLYIRERNFIDLSTISYRFSRESQI